MKKKPELVVMLTWNDHTVPNAVSVFESCKDSKAKFWGMKEEGIPLEEMKQLYQSMKACGKTTFLEVVTYTEEEGLAGAEIGAACGCEILMGTMFHDSIAEFCRKHNMKYMPFVGQVTERPSILNGSAEGMIQEAKRYLEKGACGIDLLGYRYQGDAELLIEEIVKGVPAPVCVAGSIDSTQRLDKIKEIAPWSFTIGSAFFEHKFGEDIADQIDMVCDYISGEEIPC